MANEIKEGDTVVLKSGSPVMTVSHVQHSELVTCFWFSGDEIKWAEINPITLKKVENPPVRK